jgi:hypothetical protein
MYFVALQQGLIGAGVALLGAASRVDDNSLPVSEALTVAVEVEERFAKQPFVEPLIALKVT